MAVTQDSQGISQIVHTEREWQKKFFGMGAKCYYCEEPLLLKEATKDHKTPRCRGGSDHIKNIVPACMRCNQMKGWRTEIEFAEARPALCRKSPLSAGIDKPTPTVISLDEVNEPGLLKKVVSERESGRWWRLA